MKVKELDVVSLNDSQIVTMLDVLKEGEVYLAETEAKPYGESELLEVWQKDIARAI